MTKKDKSLAILNNVNNEKKFAKEIIKIVGDYFGVDLYEDTNRHEISIPRYISVYLVREHTKKVSFEYLGGLFNRKHSGLQISVKKLKESLPYDKQRRTELKQLNSLITLSEGYGNSLAKNNLIHDTVVFLNDLNSSQVEQFYQIFSNYKVNNLEVHSEYVN